MPDRDLEIERLRRQAQAFERRITELERLIAKLQFDVIDLQHPIVDGGEDIECEPDIDPSIVADVLVENLDISDGAKAWLQKHKLATVGDIQALTLGHYLSAGINRTYLKEIEKVLSALGTSFHSLSITRAP